MSTNKRPAAASVTRELAASVLATPHQRLVEARALAIAGRPEMAAAKDRITALFKADRNARLRNQDALIAQSAAEHCQHAALIAAGETPLSPCFVWTIAMAHQWLGIDMPGSRIGQDNPDNVYRFASVDASQRYILSGQFTDQPPTDFSLCSLPAHVGEGIAANVCGIITRDTIDVDGDGRFEVVVDSTPTEGRRNHLCIAGAKVLMGRDTLADWGEERPAHLSIKLVDAEASDDFDIDAATARAAQLAFTIAEFFLRVVQHGMCEVEAVNTIPPPVASAGRGGLVTQSATLGYYQLAEGEAWVISIDMLGARYLGVQLCDMWMLSYEYRQRASSLNHRQALADNDGRVRMVVSATDPGVHNWLDGSSHDLGTILVRWHGIPAGADFANSVVAEVVAIEDLPTYLPAETRWLDAKERSQQQAERLHAYNHRIYLQVAD